MNRFGDIEFSCKRLPPVYGYHSENLVSIEKALESVQSHIRELSRYIKVAKQYCHYPSEHGLTRDESAAVYIYTMEWGDNTLYRVLNKALRSENRKALKIWFPYLKLFDTALDKLPTVKEILWRGVPLDIGKSFTKNQLVTWWSVNSCSSSLDVIKDFLGDNKTSTLFLIEAIKGTNISGYTEYENEDEIILRMGTQFRVKSNALDQSNGSYVVHLVEVDDNNDELLASAINEMHVPEKPSSEGASVNDENVEYLNHDQLEDKLRRINNSETIRLFVTDENVYRAFKQSSENIRIKPNLIEQSKLNPNLQQNRRQYRLQRNPDFEDYGFRVRSNQQLHGASHQIISVEPYSPADIQGLRVGDYILCVNNQTVEHMNATDFTYLMQSLVRNDTTRDGNLLLEVMDEDTYRSINHLLSTSQQYQPPIDAITTDRQTPTRSGYDSMTDEPYPRMRQCFVRPWPNYGELGFTIIQTPNSVNGGYQIQQLRLDSPAAHTHIRNGDHLIQVNNINVEAIDFQSVYQLINESYRRDGEVSLLVIDDNGYQWYKQNHYCIDPLSQRANITRHVTPEYHAVYTSTDSSVISPPMRHTTVKPMSDQREIQIALTPYQPSRPPLTGTSNRPYTNGYVSPTSDPCYRSTVAPSVTSSLSRPRTLLPRADVDVVDGKSMLRFCRLNTKPGQTFGFELAQEDNKHVIRHVKPESSAARAGLHKEDRLIEVNDENVTQMSHQDVVALIKNENNNGVVRLLISPSNIKSLNKPS